MSLRARARALTLARARVSAFSIQPSGQLVRFASTSAPREHVSPTGADTTSILRSSSSSTEIFLVGTAHVSEKSALEVRDLVRASKPSVVVVELCEERLRTIREKIEGERRGIKDSRGRDGTSEFVRRAVGDFLGAFAPGKGANVADGLLGAAMKTFYGFFKLSGLEPGAEFKEAVREADACGAKVVCADRDVRETLSRLRESVTFQDVMSIVSGYVRPGGPEPPAGVDGADIERVVENLKTRRNVRQMREYLAYQLPKVSRVFVDERDEIMTEALLRCRGDRIVAVVGMAHMDGIESRWEEAQRRLRLKNR